MSLAALPLLDLFSGIGGFSLGLQRAGFRTVAFCEIDPWCRRLLAKHWPGVPAYTDVRELTAARIRADGIERVAAMCGGFPCQDISTAGKGAGLEGERSGLWREYSRVVGELRPEVVFVENVGALRCRGLAAVLGDFAALGYDAEWHAIPAAAVGAPHLRDRVWIVAVAADAHGINAEQLQGPASHHRPTGAPEGEVAQRQRLRAEPGAVGSAAGAAVDPNANRIGLGAGRGGAPVTRAEPHGLGAPGTGTAAADTAGRGSPELCRLFGPLARALAAAQTPWPRTAEPPLRGVDDGLPAGLDGPGRARHAKLIRGQDRERTKALGNAVVPYIPELLGRAYLEAYR